MIDLRFLWVLPVLTLGILPLILLLPIVPGLQEKQFGSESLMVVGGTAGLYFGLSFFSSPIFGWMSDIYGRKPILAFQAISAGLPFYGLLFSENMWIYSGLRVSSGLIGNSLQIIVFAYIADVTTVEERGLAFGFAVAAILGVSLVVAPQIANWILLQSWGTHQALYIICASIQISAFFYVLIIPESMVKAENNKVLAKNISFSKIAMKSAKFLKNAFTETKYLRALLIVALFKNILDGGVQQLVTNYLIKVYDFKVDKLANFFSVVGGGTMICQTVLLYLGMKFCDETYLFITVLICQSVHSICYGIGGPENLVYTAAALGCLGNISLPLLTHIVSSTASSQDQGKIQGTLGAVSNLGQAIGPIVFGLIFDACIAKNVLLGLPFIIFGVFLILVSLWSMPIIKNEMNNKKEDFLKNLIKTPLLNKSLLKTEEEEEDKEIVI